MKTRAQCTRMLCHRVVRHYFHLMRGKNHHCYKSPIHLLKALKDLSADRSRLSTSDHLTYGFKARLISLLVVHCQALKSPPNPLLTPLKANQDQPRCLARMNHQGNTSSLSSKYLHYLLYPHALIRRMNLRPLSSETSPMAPCCLRNRSSVLCQTKRCSFKLQRLLHHQGRLSQPGVRTHHIGQLHRRQR